MFLFLSESILISLLIDFANKVECCLIYVYVSIESKGQHTYTFTRGYINTFLLFA